MEIVDINSIEEDLQTQINRFSSFSKNNQLDEPLKTIFEEMTAIINAYYNIIFQLKRSYRINKHAFSRSDSKVLLLSNFKTDIFNNMQLLSEKLQVPIFTIINELMRNFLINNISKSKDIDIGNLNYQSLKKRLIMNKNEITISNKDFVEVMKSDMSEIDVIFNFRDIEILIFKDISIQEFQDNIGMIKYCKTVFLPKNIPKLLIYSKMQYIETIKTYESLNDVYDAIFIFN